MTGPIPHKGETDDDVQGWMSEAGDPLVAPRPEHVEDLRAMILDRLPTARPARAKFHGLRWLAAAAVLAATALGLLSLLGQRSNAWAQVVQAMQEKPWVHIVGREQNGPDFEGWISPRNEILAVNYDRGPTDHVTEYHDLRTAIYFKYVPEEKTIYRLPERGRDKEQSTDVITLMRKLIRGEISIEFFLPNTEMTGPKISEVVEDGKPWIAYQWTPRTPGRSTRSTSKTRLLVDPMTKLPQSWDVDSVGGEKYRMEFDYPDSGPADILGMGVPADSKRVDRVPSGDLDRLLNGLAAGRNRFDDYQGLVWESGQSSATRVFRKGRKWRVERVTPKFIAPAGPGLPSTADITWWRAHEQHYHFELQAVSDGRTVWYYRYPPRARGPGDPYKPGKPSLVMSHKVHGSDDDPHMPWPHMLPEQIGHPHVSDPRTDRAFLVDPTPADGPPRTIRLSVRDTNADPKQPDESRLWVDPEKNFLATRAERSVYDPSATGKATGPLKVLSIEVNILEDFAPSPGGFWYPTRVRRQIPVNDFDKVKYGETITRFALDFKAPLPDELFQELVIPGDGVK